MASFMLVTLICVLTWQQSRGQQFNSSEGDNQRGPRTQFPLLTGWVFIILNSQFLYWMLSKAVRLPVLGREFAIFVESFLWFEIMQPDSICYLLLYYTTTVIVENQFSRCICITFHLHLSPKTIDSSVTALSHDQSIIHCQISLPCQIG